MMFSIFNTFTLVKKSGEKSSLKMLSYLKTERLFLKKKMNENQ